MNFAITKSQLSKELGVARSTLHRWEELPGWPTAGKKGWSVEACQKFVDKNGLTAPSELAEEKRLLTRAQRMLAEQRLRKESGELVEIEGVRQHLAVVVFQWREAIRKTVSLADANAILAQFRELHESISPDDYIVTRRGSK